MIGTSTFRIGTSINAAITISEEQPEHLEDGGEWTVKDRGGPLLHFFGQVLTSLEVPPFLS